MTDAINHSWEVLSGSNMTWKCSKCGVLGHKEVCTNDEPKPIYNDQCIEIITNQIMSS